MPKKSNFTIFAIQNFVHKTNRHVNFIYIVGIVCKVNECCLVACFCREFSATIQIMVYDYYIVKCKNLSAYSGLLMAGFCE